MFDFGEARAHPVKCLSDMSAILDVPIEGAPPDELISGFCMDSRQIKPGQIFVAIRGQRVDGHRFIDQARAAGAAACLVSSLEGIEDRRGCLLVSDTIAAMGFLAACHRRAMPAKLIALTGSVGKTTTKEMLFSILNTAYRTRKTSGNFNNTIGLPIELLKLKEDDDWFVAEMGMSTPGEIERLVAFARPDAGLWLNVHPVHMVNFNGIEEIAQAKAELVHGLREDKVLIYNLDDPLVAAISGQRTGPKVTYSFLNPAADICGQVEPFPDWNGTRLFLNQSDGQKHQIHLPVVGRFNVYNAMAACAAAIGLGMPAPDLASGLRNFQLAPHRSNLKDLDQDVLLVDDTYNANPFALEQVLRCFAHLPMRHFRWLVLGDMLELGSDEWEIHRALGKSLAGLGFDRITLVGPLCGETYKALVEKNNSDCRVEHFIDAQEAAERLDCATPAYSRIWCKASRGIGLERVASLLTTALGGRER